MKKNKTIIYLFLMLFVVVSFWGISRVVFGEELTGEIIMNRVDDNHFIASGYTESELIIYDRGREIKKEMTTYIKTENDVKYYLESIDLLYDSIKTSGYKSQYQLSKEGKNVFEKNNDTWHPFLNEVGIAIGENGQLGWVRAGMNRLIIAKLLQIDEIPVIVLGRHKKWEKVRCEISKNKSFKNLSRKAKNNINHPDIKGALLKFSN